MLLVESNSEKLKLTPSDFEEVFSDKLSQNLKDKINSYDFSYNHFTPEERFQLLLKIIKVLFQEDVRKAGEHRLSQWDKGWHENLEAFRKKGTFSALLPRYFGKYQVIRWKQDFIKPRNKDFEYRTSAVIVQWLFEKYFSSVRNIYEFGCGTGHHLLLLREINHSATLYGLDWASSSQELIAEIVKRGLATNLKAHYFNFFAPDYQFQLEPRSGVYTVAAIEQIGKNYEKFIEYLLGQKPSIIVHVEPIEELLDTGNLFDYLSIMYSRKRNYISGFLDYLKNLEKNGRLTIHCAQRTYIGSLFIDGYSVIVWSPVK